MKLITTIVKVGISFGAWDADYVVPNTKGSNLQSVSNRGEQRRAESSARIPMDNFKSRQEAAQRDHAKEQRKLQAEDDRVVLLCRD